jgi:hypothetical protein
VNRLKLWQTLIFLLPPRTILPLLIEGVTPPWKSEKQSLVQRYIFLADQLIDSQLKPIKFSAGSIKKQKNEMPINIS